LKERLDKMLADLDAMDEAEAAAKEAERLAGSSSSSSSSSSIEDADAPRYYESEEKAD